MISTRVRLQIVVLSAIAYLMVGLCFAATANANPPGPARAGWRLAAYVVSALVFAGQFAYERKRTAPSVMVVASDCGLSVALGAFGLALAADARLWWGAAAEHHVLVAALLVWPVVTGVPAFALALGAAVVLKGRRPPG